jgi:protein-tyrosine phosphatase
VLLVDADEIAPNLWQGSWPGIGKQVRDSGFSMLVLCAEEHQEPEEDFPGVDVIYAPNYDDGIHPLDRELLQDAIQAARQVTQAVRSNRKVLVTCKAGLNRSGLVVGIALHLLFGWSGSRCIERIRLLRKDRHKRLPLGNDEFVNALQQLGRPGWIPRGWRETPGGVFVPV